MKPTQARSHTQVDVGSIKWPTSEGDFSPICIIRGASSDMATTTKYLLQQPTSQQRPLLQEVEDVISIFRLKQKR